MRRLIPFVLISLAAAITLGLFLLAPRSALVRSPLEERRKVRLSTDALEIAPGEALP